MQASATQVFKYFTFKQHFLAVACLLCCSLAHAQINNPIRDGSMLPARTASETVQRLAKARVILADYELLKKDFPVLKDLSNESIDTWLLDRTAFVSLAQIESKGTNNTIPITEERVQAFRPPDYNRALVFQTEKGLIDSKGNGSSKPKVGGHSNGLATLGEVIREYIYQKLVQKIFDHSKSGLKTVGCYAVIDYGFRVIHVDGSSSPAGAVLRQAHQRALGYMSNLPTKDNVRIEKILRKYGITSTGTKRDSLDIINVQGTRDSAVIDFGGFLAVNKRTRPAVVFNDWGWENNQTKYFTPGTPEEILPDPKIQIPYELWGSMNPNDEDSKTDKPFIWSHELAESLVNGTAQRIDAERHVHNLLDPVEQIFRKHPRAQRISPVPVCGKLY